MNLFSRSDGKMADKFGRKSWCQLLPSVYDLLLEKVDGVVDDTSLEKLLGWLEDVCKDDLGVQRLLAVDTGTVHFLRHERVFGCAKALAIALRLCGLLCSRKSVYSFLSAHQEGSIIEKLFGKSVVDPMVWSDGGVRDAYFIALKQFMGHEEGFSWLKQSGCLSVALNCIDDRSMFVAASARSFLVKYVIKIYQETNHCGDAIPAGIASVTKRLQQVLQTDIHAPQDDVSSQRIAVIDVVRILLEGDAGHGLTFVKKTGLFVNCLQQFKTADSSVCDKLVDVLRELGKNKNIVDWGELLQDRCEGQAKVEVLLELPLVLLSRGFISQGLYLAVALGSYLDCPSDTPISWLKVLFEVMTATVNVALDSLGKDNKLDNSDLQMNGNFEADVKCLVKNLIAREDSECEKVDHISAVFNHIVAPWLHTRSMCCDVVCQAMNASQELFKEVDVGCLSPVLNWTQLALRLLKACFAFTAETSEKLAVHLYGNERVLKCCLDCITSFTGVLESCNGRQDRSVTDLSKEVLEVLITLIQNSETSTTVVSCALKTTGHLLKRADEDLMSEIFGDTDDVLSPCVKRAKYDKGGEDSDGRDGRERHKSGWIRERLGFVLHHKLRDRRWEVRDSVLELILVLVDIGRDPVEAFLYQFNIPCAVWEAVSDSGESYVRASALQALGALACHDQLWSNLLQTCLLTEVDVVKRIARVLLEDEEAFPRRTAMSCLVQWMKARHPVLRTVLELEEPGDQTTLGAMETDPVVSENKEVAKEPDEAKNLVAGSIRHACQDFDWEVKLLGIKFLEAVVGYFTSIESSVRGSTNMDIFENGEVSQTSMFTQELKQTSVNSTVDPREGCLHVLAGMGACKILLDAVSDCDHMVCEEALLLLIKLKEFCFPEDESCEYQAQSSEDIQQALSTCGTMSLDKFREILRITNFTAALHSSTAADSTVRSDPVSFLEDILSAAGDHEENLLDCY